MTAPQGPPFAPANIYQMSIAHWQTKVLLTAAEVGIFKALGEDGHVTATELSNRLGLHQPTLHDLLDSLVALGLLDRTDDRYRNSAEADLYLVPGKRYFMGGYLNYVGKFIMPVWEGLPDLLRDGDTSAAQPEPQPEPGETVTTGKKFYEQNYLDNNTIRLVLGVAEALASPLAWVLNEVVDWSEWNALVDLGGGRGNVASILLEANPQLQATVFDLPPLQPFFDELIKERGMADRMQFEPGDWFGDPLPEGDVLLCGHALHNWDAGRQKMVIEKAFHAVRPGGALMVYDLMIDPDRSRANPLMLSLLLRLRGMGGSGYPASQCEALMHAAGFDEVQTLRLPDHDGHTLVIGRKSR